jgi:magnesium transporter
VTLRPGALATGATVSFDLALPHLARKVPVAEPGATVGVVRAALEGARLDSASHVAVCEGGKLHGLVRLEDLLAAAAETTLAEIMDADPPIVGAGTEEEAEAWKAVRHGESALAVVDGQGRFQGLVPPDRMVGALLAEHDDEAAQLGRWLHDTSAARAVAEEPVAVRIRHRLPWLLLGLAGSLAAAGLVGSFERELKETVLLAAFIPGVVYMADAVGTQTEALVIRGLSVGVPVRKVLGLELLTGLGVGTVLAAAFFPAGVALWGDVDIVVAVAVALLAACSVATCVAMAIPALLVRIGRDPAFASGPLATVIQDLLSLMIYLMVARAVVG